MMNLILYEEKVKERVELDNNNSYHSSNPYLDAGHYSKSYPYYLH